MKKIFLAIISVLAMTSCGNAQGGKGAEKAKPMELDKTEFLKRVVDFEGNPTEWKYLGDKPAIVDFYAVWCGPCKQIAPILEELAVQYADSVSFYKVDAEKQREVAAAFGVRAYPTLLFIPLEGKPTIMTGARSKAEFIKLIDELLLGKK